MKNSFKKVSCTLLIIVIMATIFTACADKKLLTPDENGIVTINASSEAQKMLEDLSKNGSKEHMQEGNFEVVREKLLRCEPEVLPEVEVKNKLDHTTCAGFDMYSLSDGDYENIVFFIHGGAWVFGILADHVTFCDKLVDTMNAKVYMPLYPLGPKYGYQDTYNMLAAAYDELLKEGKPIYVMGDSAGGQLTLMMATIFRDTGRKAPEKLVALAPCADLSFTNPDIDEVEKRDPTLAKYGVTECAKMWVKDTDLKDPVVSLNYTDVSNLPDTLMFVGTNDMLSPDDMILFDRMKAAGNNIILVKGNGLWHVYSTYDLPERDISLKMIREFCLGGIDTYYFHNLGTHIS